MDFCLRSGHAGESYRAMRTLRYALRSAAARVLTGWGYALMVRPVNRSRGRIPMQVGANGLERQRRKRRRSYQSMSSAW